ncbi:hypothetical protein FHR72_001265 [Mycolicibacterium iranicum]|uniref:PE-PPE domain-containing protein n=1 Tax=Mycolicibacterium iranicum TaxID=912594 RepID=A0A839Q9A8_MYCIR|nr:PE-PPE domain-containing protein [Mycolicibacterium iranicum]MBB2989802.1 hypothetical protein [Mycolicibacterium iranicum]
MRHQLRAVVLVIVSLVAAMSLAVASAFVSALAYGATALIVPGTGTPDADAIGRYRENAWSRYIDGVACTDPVECANPDLVGIPYPASFWPLSILPGWCVPGRCEKWDVSVDEGVENLMAALSPFLTAESDEDVFIFGYSQGGAVVANALTELAALNLSDDVLDRLKVVTIGGIENPDGGLWQRLAWLRYFLGNPIPILDVSFDPAMPVDTGIDTTSIGFEYDPVVYAPKYWGNIVAVLNMIAAFDTVHGYYLDPTDKDPEDEMPYGYTDATLAQQLDCDRNPGNCRTDGFGNTYIMIPATSLPLMDLVRSLADSLRLGWLAEPFIDLAEPVVREMVDLGYDWSGDPGVPSRSTILPFKIFQNWLKVGVDFAVAAVQGIEAFIRNFIPAREETRLEDTGDGVQTSVEPADADASVSPLHRTALRDETPAAAVDDGVDAADEETTPTQEAPATVVGGDAAAGDEEVAADEEPVTDITDGAEVTDVTDTMDTDDATDITDGTDATEAGDEEAEDQGSVGETADGDDEGSDTVSGTQAAA